MDCRGAMRLAMTAHRQRNNYASLYFAFPSMSNILSGISPKRDRDGWVSRDRGPRRRRHEYGGDGAGQDPAS
jgi:hypothetical protein